MRQRFFLGKGLFALNVQVIVDDKKRVLWVSYSNRGGSHDSSCFKDSKLYKTLQEMKDDLYEKKLFLIGDSAYST